MAIIERLAVLVDAQTQGAVREFQKLSREAGKTDTALTGVQKTSGALKGALATVGWVGAATAVAGFADQSIKAASALDEMQSKSEVVFGDSAKRVEAFAKDTADSLALSERATYQYAASFGQLFDSAGLVEQQATDFSLSLTALSSDIASFNDISVDEAFQKLRSGLSGEAEPLRQVGVFLSEAKVQEEAYAAGIAKRGEKLTEAQKIQARYNIILRETATAQGDVARTADSLANRQRSLNAEIEDFKAQAGESLAPELAESLGLVNDALQAFGDINQSIKDSTEGRESVFTLFRDGALDALGPIGASISVMFDWRDATEEAGAAADDAYTSLYDVGGAAEVSAAGIEVAGSATRGLLDGLGQVPGSAEPAASGMRDFGDTTDDVRLKAEAADEKIRGLTDALDAMQTPFLDIRAAERELQDALAGVNAAIAENGTTLDITTEAGRRNQAALDDVASAAFGALEAFAQTSPTAGDLAQKALDMQGFLAGAAEQFGYTAAGARDLATQAGLVPENVPIYVKAYGLWETLGALERVNYLLSTVGAVNVWQAGYDLSGVGPGFRASGGPVGDGMYLVGEKGPELLSLRGTTGQVYSNAKTRTMLEGAGGYGVYVANMTVVANDYDDFTDQMYRDQALKMMPGVRA